MISVFHIHCCSSLDHLNMVFIILLIWIPGCTYSMVGLTSDWYVFSFRFELLMLRFLFKKLKVLFAFLQMLAMCSLHFISDVINTPRYLVDGTCSS